MALVAQAELVGRPFNRKIHMKRGEGVVDFAHAHRVRVAALLNTNTGDVQFRPLREVPSEISHFPQLPLHGTIFDSAAHEGSSLSNVLKKGASSPYMDTDAAFQARGGDLESPLKQNGFTLSSTRKEIAVERERKKREVTFGPHVAAVYEAAREHSKKTGGFASSRTALELVKERNRKKYLKREAEKQRKNRFLEFP